MDFRYRFVDYGTTFSPAAGNRETSDVARHQLFENEIAVDVGGVCWGFDGEEKPILDHHFHRKTGQFPSASAAVLHHADRIHAQLGNRSDNCDVVWLVTHREPDFDAFCSMYLVRCILREVIPHDVWQDFQLRPHGWFQGRDEVAWFSPDINRFPLDRRWPVLLAAYAACVDNCRTLLCPKHRSLHSVLYAAIRRGRDYLSECSGATDFFEEVIEKIRDPAMPLNPLFDAVFDEQNSRFQPELQFLDRELDAYHRDIGRARCATINVREATYPFETWFDPVAALPLLDDNLVVESKQLEMSNQLVRQIDGVYLRDPECLLFKEWARDDTENAPMGNGIQFTAIAYSRGRPHAALNKTDYFFALDPERAGNRHLYNVWARLQAAEVRAMLSPEQSALREELEKAETEAKKRAESDEGERGTASRLGFEDRAGKYRALFSDPWFDGSNYQCTIVPTPNRGTLIGPAGQRGDLLDDPVVQIVRGELEFSIFSSEVTVVDFTTGERAGMDERQYPLGSASQVIPAAAPGCFRFCRVQLNDDIDVLKGDLGKQIGELLWRLLDSERSEGVPTDFVTRHLLLDSDGVRIWSRRGVVVANRARARDRSLVLEQQFREMMSLVSDFESLSARTQPIDSSREQFLEEAQSLMQRVARLKHLLALPEGRVLRRFFEASRLDEVSEIIRDTSFSSQMAENLNTVAAVQKVIHLIEYILGAAYTAHLWHMIAPAHAAVENATEAHGWWEAVTHYLAAAHWDVLVAAVVGVGLVETFNYAVEGHCPLLLALSKYLPWKRKE